MDTLQPLLFGTPEVGRRRRRGKVPVRNPARRSPVGSAPPTLLDAAADSERENRLRRSLDGGVRRVDRRVLANLEVLRLAVSLAEQQRSPTPQERRQLATFTPWQQLSLDWRQDPLHEELREEMDRLLADLH